MLVNLKFSIHDKVTCYSRPYEIKMIRVTLDHDGLHIQYCFHAYCDKVFDYWQLVDEKFISIRDGETAHPFSFDFDVKDHNGEHLSLGDSVYHTLYWNRWNGEDMVCPDLTFSGYGFITEMRYEQEIGNFEMSPQVLISRTAVCTNYEGKPHTDGRREGNINRCFPYDIDKTVDTKKFTNDYLRAILKKDAGYVRDAVLNNKQNIYYSDVIKMLQHLGIYDDVVAGIKAGVRPSKKPSKPSAAKKKDKKSDADKCAAKWKALAMKLAKEAGVEIDADEIKVK